MNIQKVRMHKGRSSQIRTIACKRRGGYNFGDFCAYLLCGWPHVTIGNPAFCLALYFTGAPFEASYSTLVTSVSKKSSVDQSELEKYVVSHCTQSKIYDGTFIAKIANCYVYSQKISIVDVRLGSKYVSAFTWKLPNVSLKYFTLWDPWNLVFFLKYFTSFKVFSLF